MSAPDQKPNPYTSPDTQPPTIKPRGRFAPCPVCGHTNAMKVSWTLWGGALGPAMLCHVRCNHCGSTYNGETGRSNSTAIAIYLIVSLVIGGAIGGAICVAVALSSV